MYLAVKTVYNVQERLQSEQLYEMQKFEVIGRRIKGILTYFINRLTMPSFAKKKKKKNPKVLYANFYHQLLTFILNKNYSPEIHCKMQ